MDQTPVFFSMENKTTLDLAELKTIHMQSSTSDTKRSTVAVTVSASGHQHPLTVILKGEPGGRIERHEIPRILLVLSLGLFGVMWSFGRNQITAFDIYWMM